jgi:hypothetical protein
MGVSLKLLGTKKAEKVFALAAKKSKRSADCAFEDTTMFAHETAVKRARSRKIRPFWRTGNYTRSINFSISSKGTFTGKIFSPVTYAKKLENWYENLKISAETAIKEFPRFMKKCYKEEMGRTR